MKRLLLGLITMLVLASPAHAGDPTLPPAPSVGGCDEAYIAPQSEAADDCRARGWTVRVGPMGHGIIVSPRSVVRYLWLPQCINEDGSGQRSACTWNMVMPYQGDGLGRALWIDRADRVHYVKRTLPKQEM